MPKRQDDFFTPTGRTKKKEQEQKQSRTAPAQTIPQTASSADAALKRMADEAAYRNYQRNKEEALAQYNAQQARETDAYQRAGRAMDFGSQWATAAAQYSDRDAYDARVKDYEAGQGAAKRLRENELRRIERDARSYGRRVSEAQKNNPALYYSMMFSEDELKRKQAEANRHQRMYDLRLEDALKDLERYRKVQGSAYDMSQAGNTVYDEAAPGYKESREKYDALIAERDKYAQFSAQYSAALDQKNADRLYAMEAKAQSDPYAVRVREAGRQRFEQDNAGKPWLPDFLGANRITRDVVRQHMNDEDYAAWSAQLRNDVLDTGKLQESDKDTFYYLYATDPEAAMEWIENRKNERQQEYYNEIAESAGADPEHRLRAFVGGVGASIGAGLLYGADVDKGYASELAHVGKALTSGGARGLEEHGIYNTGVLAGTLPEEIPYIGGKGLGAFYELGTSMLQSAAVMPLGPEGAILLGYSAAASDYADMKDQGFSDKEATLHAACAGLAESIFEYISLDKLLSQNFDEKAGIFKQLFAQSGIEASEEINTTIANTITDEAILGSRSQRSRRVQELMAQGMSHSEAQKQADTEWLSDLVFDGIAGAMSGGFMTAGNLGVQKAFGSYAERAAKGYANESTGRAVREDRALIEDLNRYARDHELKEISEAGAKTGDTSSALRAPSTQGEGGVGAAEASASTSGNEIAATSEKSRKQTREQKRQEKADTRAARKLGAQANAILDHIDDSLTGKTIRESESTITEAKKNYPALSEILDDAAYRAAAKLYAKANNAAELEQLHKDNAEGIKDKSLRNAVADAYELNVGRLAENGDQRAKLMNAARWSMRNGALDLAASYRGTDGTEVQSEVAGISKDGKRIVLTDGTTRAVDELELDADTGDILGKLVKYGLGKDADVVFQAYQKSVAQGDVTSGYGFLSEFLTAMAYGRTNGATEQQALARSNRSVIPEAAVRLAYELGVQQSEQARARQAEIDRKREKVRENTSSVADAAPSPQGEGGGRQSAVPTSEKESGAKTGEGKPSGASRHLPSAEGRLEGRIATTGDAGIAMTGQKDGAKTGDTSSVAAATPSPQGEGRGRERSDKTASGREGRIDSSRLKGKIVSRDAQKQINLWAQITRRLGIDTVLFSSELDEDGKYKGMNGEYRDGKLWIDVNAGKNQRGDVSGFLRTVAHELTHFGREYSPAFYEDLKRFAFATLGEKRGLDSFEGYAARKLERDSTGRLTRVDAEEEIVADACETMLRNSEVVRQALERDRKPVERVLRRILDFFKKLVGLAEHDEAKVFEEFTDKLNELQRLWDRMILDAAETHREIGDIKNTADEGGEKFSIRNTKEMTLKEQLSEYYKPNGKFKSSDAFYFGESDPVLQKSGIIPGPLAMTISDFLKSTKKKHNTPRRVLNNLAKNLKTPVLSFGKNGEVGFIIDDIDGDGKPILVAIHTNEEMDWEHVNKITSIYGLDSPAEWIKNQIESGKKLVIYNKTQGEKFLQSYSYEATERNTVRPDGGIIPLNAAESNPSGENNSEPHSDRDNEEYKAKHKGTQEDIRYSERDSYGRELSGKQQEFFENSKARDKDGNLLVLYRGKRGGETVIHGDYRGAIWTTTDPEFADRYGVKDELYANISNPYYKTVYNTDSDTGYDIDKVIHDAKSNGHDGAIISFTLNPDVATGYVEFAAKNYPDEPASEILESWAKSAYMDAHDGETIAEFWKRANEGPVSQHVVVFSSEQIKRTDNKNPTKNKDIRYSEREGEELGTFDPVVDAFGEEFARVLQSPEYSGESGRAFQALIDDLNRREGAREEWFNGTAQDAFEALFGEEEEKAKEKIRKRIQKAKEKAYQRAYNNARERQKKAELRERFRNLRKDLANRVLKPSDRTHIPAGLTQSVVNVLDAIDGIAAPRARTQSREDYRALADAVRATARNYAALEANDDPVWAQEYDAEIMKQINRIDELLTAKYEQLREKRPEGAEGLTTEDVAHMMTSGELQTIYDTVKTIRDTLRDASKLFNQEINKGVYEAAEAIRDRQSSMARKGVPENLKRMIARNSISTMRAVEIMSDFDRSSPLYRLWAAVEDGADNANRWIMDYNKHLNELRTGKNEKTYRDSLNRRIDYGLVESDEDGKETGRKVPITKQQAIQLIMSFDREARSRIRHLERGGAMFETEDSKPGARRRARVFVTLEQINEIRKTLTAWDKAYMDAMRAYLKTEGRETNKVLYALKHRALALEEYYVPLIVDDSYLEAKVTEDNYDRLFTKSFGSTEQMKVNAPQPIVIDGMEQMMQKHVSDAANYIGLAMPIRDFAKVYNARMAVDSTAPGSEEKISYTTVAKALQKNFDQAAKSTMLKTLAEVQGVRNGNTWRTELGDRLNKLQGAFVKSALLINPSVTIKQAASYYAAFSILSQKALTAGNRALFTSTDASHAPTVIAYLFANPQSKTAQRLFNEIDEHTAEHAIRRQGMDYTEIGDSVLREGKIKQLTGSIGAKMEQTKAGHAARKALAIANPLHWIQRMDVATTAALWIACKEQAKLNGFKVGSDEFWTETTQLYRRCLRETQPMYDPLHRAGIQKADGLMKYLFPFRTVPIQNHGQLAMAYEAWKNSAGEQKQQAKRFLAKTLWAQAGSAAIFTLLTALAAGMKHKTGNYRDDDDELTIQSLLAGLGSDYLSVWASNVFPILGSDTLEFAKTGVNILRGREGRTYDTVSVGVVDMINSVTNSVYAALREAEKLASGESTDRSRLYDKLLALGLDLATAFGIPAKTIKSYVLGARANVEDIIYGRLPAWNDVSEDRANGVNADRWLRAFTAGDAAKAQAVVDEMLQNIMDSGKSEYKARKSMNSTILDHARDAYAAGKLTDRQVIDVAAALGKDEDQIAQIMTALYRKQYAKGQIDADEAGRLMQEYAGKSENDVYWELQKWDYAIAHEDEDAESWDKYIRLDDALASDNGVQDASDELSEHGVEFKTVNSHIKSEVAGMLKNGEITKEQAAELLSAYWKIKENGKYKTPTADDVYWTLDKIRYGIETGDDEDAEGYSVYLPLREAIDANKDVTAARKELTDHGYKDSEIDTAIKAHLNRQYRAGVYSDDRFTKYLARYLGIVKKDEVDKLLNEGKCYKEFGITTSEANTAYKDGVLTRKQMETLLTRYKGMTEQEAEQRIAAVEFTETHKELSWSVDTAENYLGKTPTNAANAKTRYPAGYLCSAQEIGLTAEQYDEYLAIMANLEYESGKTGAKKTAAMRAIDGMEISDAQKDWLYCLNGWAWGEVKDAPWR